MRSAGCSWLSTSVEETVQMGCALGALLQNGDVIGLLGPLGVGKTALVRGIAEGVGTDPAYVVTSPTFVFLQTYPGRCLLHHIDLYRVESEKELWALGLEEMLGEEGVAVVEWFDRFPTLWEASRVEVSMAFAEEERRTLQAKGIGARGEEIVKAWKGPKR